LSYPGPTNGGLATANIHTRTYRPRTLRASTSAWQSRRGVRTAAPPAAPRQALATRLGRQARKPSVPRRISVTSPCVGHVPCASVRPAARGPAVSARRRPREVDKPYRPIQCRIVVLLTSSRVAIARSESPRDEPVLGDPVGNRARVAPDRSRDRPDRGPRGELRLQPPTIHDKANSSSCGGRNGRR